jgi:hypothetical protein
MPLTPRQLREIERSDAVRRAERYLLENAQLGLDTLDTASDAFKIAHAPKDAHVNPCLVRGAGMVCPPPKTSASQNSWNRGMRGTMHGIAPGTEATNNGIATVAITKDGITTVQTVHSVRTKNARRRSVKTTTANHVTETSRIELRGMDWSQ